MNDGQCVGVCFEDVSVCRQGRAILSHASARAPCGGATVIVGPNGAGKTTLLRCLLGEAAYAGKIIFCNAQGEQISRPGLGYVPQALLADAQLPLRVYEFMALSAAGAPLWLCRAARAKNACRPALELVEAEKLAGRRMGELSGGELRRVLLAAALARRPQLLVLDEAEAGVDYRGERMFWELLDRTRRENGFTLLMVSHNLPLAAHYATHVICVKQTVLAEGAPRETLTAANLLTLFGVPIHLYPRACDDPGPPCPECGAFGNLPYFEDAPANAGK